MRFPLRDWIDAHPGLRHNLASSGMRGAIRPPPWPARPPASDADERLREELSAHLGVAPERLFLAPGATEANAWVLGHLARALTGRSRRLRVRFPEYPPLYDAGRALGFSVSDGEGPAAVAVVSQPRNPEGDLWSRAEFDAWRAGARSTLVDETFREFAGVPSVARRAERGVWATGTFTKYFGADDVRVGFAVAPPEAVGAFERYVGLLSDELAPASAARALALLRHIGRVRREVRSVVEPNLEAYGRLFPGTTRPRAPVVFDRPEREGGTSLANRCLRGSILVCPGRFFGAPRGVRLCLTRPNAARALRAYRAVRDERTAD